MALIVEAQAPYGFPGRIERVVIDTTGTTLYVRSSNPEATARAFEVQGYKRRYGAFPERLIRNSDSVVIVK